MPPSRCPDCGELLNAAGTLDSDGEPPGPGDVTLCIACGTVCLFDTELRLVAATREDEEELRATVPADYATMKRHQMIVRMRRGA